jgi:hypothetical protein
MKDCVSRLYETDNIRLDKFFTSYFLGQKFEWKNHHLRDHQKEQERDNCILRNPTFLIYVCLHSGYNNSVLCYREKHTCHTTKYNAS